MLVGMQVDQGSWYLWNIKAGVHARALAKDLAEYVIRVNALFTYIAVHY
jgi:hypothetical protein